MFNVVAWKSALIVCVDHRLSHHDAGNSQRAEAFFCPVRITCCDHVYSMFEIVPAGRSTVISNRLRGIGNNLAVGLVFKCTGNTSIIHKGQCIVRRCQFIFQKSCGNSGTVPYSLGLAGVF